MNTNSYFISGQGGDYHVFPDGRMLFTGNHGVHDPAHGFNGQYSLVWFSNTGWLDTTRIHRQTNNGAIYRIAQLDNGQFYCGGAFTQYEDHPAYALARVEADGAYDPSFQTEITWGEPQALHPLPDGRLWVGGDFTFQGTTDTLRLMRFMPDGSLDPTFNTSHTFNSSFTSTQLSMINNITEVAPNHFAVTGYFNQVDGEDHHGIAMFDSSGTLLSDYFPGSGAGIWTYMNGTGVTLVGIMPTGDGTDDYYIWGSYHGYDDGSTNDTLQRMVSRLHGLSVGVAEQPEQVWPLKVYPNPASTSVSIETNLVGSPNGAVLVLHDIMGREVERMAVPKGKAKQVLDVRDRTPGAYTAELVSADATLATVRFIIRP